MIFRSAGCTVTICGTPIFFPVFLRRMVMMISSPPSLAMCCGPKRADLVEASADIARNRFRQPRLGADAVMRFVLRRHSEQVQLGCLVLVAFGALMKRVTSCLACCNRPRKAFRVIPRRVRLQRFQIGGDEVFGQLPQRPCAVTLAEPLKDGAAHGARAVS